MEKLVREQLFELSEEKYRQFSSSLIPNINNVIGVRLPLLRKLARKLARNDWRSYLASADNDYFEEVLLQGMVIGYADAGLEERLRYVAEHVPKISSWSACDSFCSGLKFAKDHRLHVWEFLQPYLDSGKEYEIRFGAIMLLMYYLDEEYLGRVLQAMDKIRHEGYYVKMAVAWVLSICYTVLPEPTMQYLKNNTLDDFTYNKALQKIIESNRVDEETKKLIRTMKRNPRNP